MMDLALFCLAAAAFIAGVMLGVLYGYALAERNALRLTERLESEREETP